MITAILFAIVYLLTYIYDLFQVQLANPIELLRQEIKVSGSQRPKRSWQCLEFSALARDIS